MEKKNTKLEVVVMLLEEEVVKANPIYAEYLANEKKLLENKAEKRKSVNTEKAKEYAKLKELVYDALALQIEPVSVSELLATLECEEIKTTQKLTPILSALADDGRIVKDTSKKKTLYSIVE